MKREKKKYLAWGLTAFLTGCALLIFYDVFYRDNTGTVQAIFAKLFSVLTPVLYGLGMAYLLAPIVNFLERAILRLRDKLERKRGRAIRIHKGWLRAASIFLTWAVVLVLVYLLLSMLVPQLVDSITTLVNNLESYYTTIYNWVTGLLSDNPELTDLFNRYYNETIQWLTTKLLPGLQTAVTNFTGSLVTGVWSVVIFTKNFLIGIIVSVYLLAAKEKSAARCCKLLYGVLPEEQAKFAAALYPAGQRGGRCDQCDSLLRPVFGGYPLRIADFAGQPAEVPVFRHFHLPAPAAGRQRHRPEDPGRFHGYFQPVGHCGHPGGRRLWRCAGYVFGRAHLRLSAGAGALAAKHPAGKAPYAPAGLGICPP